MPLKTPSTIRFQLTCLVLASVLPVWLASGFLVCHAYSVKRDQVHSSMLERAHSLSMVVDRELTTVQAALTALSTSPSFEAADFGSIHRQAQQLLKSYPGADIIIADVTGQQVVNSARPIGASLPKRNNPETVRRIFETGKPVISDLFHGAVTKRPLIGIDVPVICDGTIRYDLAMTFPSDSMASVLRQQSLAPEWYSTILDSKQVVVARSRYPERYVGSKVSSGLQREMARHAEGTAEATNLEGNPVFVTFCRSTLCGWNMVVGVPKATVMAEIYQWLAWALAGAAVISLFGIMLAVRYARGIAQAIQALVGPALSIGTDDPVLPDGAYAIKETSEVAAALVQASHLLQARARERDHAEQELSKAIIDLEEETRERLSALEELREKDRLLLQQSRQAAMGEMIGNIAHQWRQPLNTLGLIVQQMQLFYEVGSFTQKYLDESVKLSMELIQHMSRTIDDFRNYFKPDKEKTEFRVHAEVERTLSMLEGCFANQHIKIEVEAAADPVIHGYANEFSQVLLNVLINAKDAFSGADIEDPRVWIKVSQREQEALVTIADNAGGIPEEILGKIFDPYFTTKGPQSGTGVGLFMSKTIIEKNMGGRLWARNAECGAEFGIEIAAAAKAPSVTSLTLELKPEAE